MPGRATPPYMHWTKAKSRILPVRRREAWRTRWGVTRGDPRVRSEPSNSPARRYSPDGNSEHIVLIHTLVHALEALVLPRGPLFVTTQRHSFAQGMCGDTATRNSVIEENAEFHVDLVVMWGILKGNVQPTFR